MSDRLIEKGKNFSKRHLNFWNHKAAEEDKREKKNPVKQVHTDLLMREIEKVIGQRRNLYILDAGGGTGGFSFALAEMGHRLILLDISSEMLNLASRKAREKRLLILSLSKGT